MELEIELPEGFEASYSEGVLEVSDGSNTVEKKMEHALVDVDTNGSVKFSTESSKKNIQSIVKTFRSHTKNMIEGLQNEHVYKLKGVYAHFPMDIKKQGNEVVIENFMGERNPRRAQIMDGVDVEVNGEELTVRGPDKDKVSQTAARIESLSEKGNRDPRTFQDGIYITEAEKHE